MSVKKGVKLEFEFHLNIEKLKKVEFQFEFGYHRKVGFGLHLAFEMAIVSCVRYI